ncbi:hypothetical protein CONLIGDRAFT_709932 [Coniochaeta ligniaria NRRL 30616]|uniref:Uncharacterized protein n=1 Tax=Coniochaeta ligniaria NRRL 30616 TaxID=1408157 RepID=A0A1J7J3G4_9PEZI|nr:hypothetical protein CONLIGDRAFT_709932 [Coniochaeta ligniaria NRRL 30616]
MYSSIALAIFAVVAGLISSIAATAAGADTPATLTWTGEVVPGNGTTNPTGDNIQDILNQIHVTHPNYDATKATSNQKSTENDEPGVWKTFCGVFATADKRNLMEIQYDLRMAGGDCTIPARTCLRLSCWNTSGIYFCNDNDYQVTIQCAYVADFASYIGTQCCKSDFTKSKGISGQAFSALGWNVCVGYANCNHPADRDAPGIFIPPGLNGECRD